MTLGARGEAQAGAVEVDRRGAEVRLAVEDDEAAAVAQRLAADAQVRGQVEGAVDLDVGGVDEDLVALAVLLPAAAVGVGLVGHALAPVLVGEADHARHAALEVDAGPDARAQAQGGPVVGVVAVVPVPDVLHVVVPDAHVAAVLPDGGVAVGGKVRQAAGAARQHDSRDDRRRMGGLHRLG